MPDTRVVIGLGTGRSGTHSLAELLARQPGTTSLHQPAPCLPWRGDPGWYALARDLVAAQSTPIVGLVAWYYLPYVARFLADFDTRVVCLQRDRATTIASIERLTPDIDNWSSRSPELSVTSRWRELFPQYEVADKHEALGCYWDEYHARVEDLVAAHPDRVHLLPTEALNDRAGVEAVLAAAGYGADAVAEVGIRAGRMEGGYRYRGSEG